MVRCSDYSWIAYNPKKSEILFSHSNTEDGVQTTKLLLLIPKDVDRLQILKKIKRLILIEEKSLQ